MSKALKPCAPQVDLVDSSEAVAAADYRAQLQLEGVGELAIGIVRADGPKCSRCWNYSTQVGPRSPYSMQCPLQI